jgi:2-amino-4-hydroxy-6-hydroxymethyldihydropteridine diphosphokinase
MGSPQRPPPPTGSGPMPTFLGLGANLGDRLSTLQRAIDLLAAEPGITVVRTSRVWETDPVGGPPQPGFLNVVAELDTTLVPFDLLSAVNRVEAALGRTRDVRWGPRTIDIDILLIDDLIIDDDRLTVPHPRMHQRAFVVMPLLELLSDPVLPDDTHLLDIRLPDQQVHPAYPPLAIPA